MCEVRREIDGQNTLQYIQQCTKLSEPQSRVQEVPSAKQQLSLRGGHTHAQDEINHGCQSNTLHIHVI
jgi:hypothetical protein